MLESRRLLLPILALFALLAPAQASPLLETVPARVPDSGSVPLLQRVAVIGASVSAGHGLRGATRDVRLDLSKVIEASLLAEHGPVINASSRTTFLDPVGNSQVALAALSKQDPTLVVALDYLFWFGYGSGWKGEKERLGGLELGLKSLEGLKCPILLGDFPDMHSALKAEVPVLPADAVPDAETLGKLNQRLAAWAKERPNVILVPVSKLMNALLSGDELRVGPNLWRKDTVGALLQRDGLHPTLEGTTGMWLFALERLREARKELPETAFETKVGTIDERLAPGLELKVVLDPIQKKTGKTAPAKSVH